MRADIRQAVEPRTEPAMVEAFVEILRSCQEVDDPSAALTRIAGRLHGLLAASMVAFLISDRDRPHAVAHAGAAWPSYLVVARRSSARRWPMVEMLGVGSWSKNGFLLRRSSFSPSRAQEKPGLLRNVRKTRSAPPG